MLQKNLIYDVGLHKGEDTDFYLKKGFDVVAFEANPDLVAHCKNRFKEAIATGRLRIVEGAIAPESAGGTLTFYQNKQLSVWGTIDAEWAERNRSSFGADSVEVVVKRVDVADVLQEYGVPFYVKVDVEGADHLVLDALGSFEIRPQYISIESEKNDFAKLQSEIDLLVGLGYKKFKAVQQGAVPGRTLVTEDLNGERLEHVFEPESSGPFGEDIHQPWVSRDQLVEEYRRIYKMYRLFGDRSLLRSLKGGGTLIGHLERIYRKPLPGWYDTHASL